MESLKALIRSSMEGEDRGISPSMAKAIAKKREIQKQVLEVLNRYPEHTIEKVSEALRPSIDEDRWAELGIYARAFEALSCKSTSAVAIAECKLFSPLEKCVLVAMIWSD